MVAKVFIALFLLIAILMSVACRHDGDEIAPLVLTIGPEPETFWSLVGIDTIIDAEYDKVHDRIVAVSADPDQLMVIDPVAKTITTIPLNADPTCVSVADDGNSAVAGHNGWISWVDHRCHDADTPYLRHHTHVALAVFRHEKQQRLVVPGNQR